MQTSRMTGNQRSHISDGKRYVLSLLALSETSRYYFFLYLACLIGKGEDYKWPCAGFYQIDTNPHASLNYFLMDLYNYLLDFYNLKGNSKLHNYLNLLFLGQRNVKYIKTKCLNLKAGHFAIYTHF